MELEPQVEESLIGDLRICGLPVCGVSRSVLLQKREALLNETEHANDMGAGVVLDRAISRPGARYGVVGRLGRLGTAAHLQSTPFSIRTVKEPLANRRRVYLAV